LKNLKQETPGKKIKSTPMVKLEEHTRLSPLVIFLTTFLTKMKFPCRDLPLTNADWLMLTTSPNLLRSLFTIILENGLEKLCTRLIGR
jgi:hypothetical protein